MCRPFLVKRMMNGGLCVFTKTAATHLSPLPHFLSSFQLFAWAAVRVFDFRLCNSFFSSRHTKCRTKKCSSFLLTFPIMPIHNFRTEKKKCRKNFNWISRQQHQHYLNICTHSARDRFWTICYGAIAIYLSIESNRRATKLEHIDVIAFDLKKPTWICNEKPRRNCLSRTVCVLETRFDLEKRKPSGWFELLDCTMFLP